MNQLRWYLIRIIKSLGVIGVAAVVLFVISGSIVIFGLLPMQQEIKNMQKTSPLVRERALQQMQMRLAQPDNDPEKQLVDFYKFFVSKETLTDKLAHIYGAAQTAGLNLKQGQYRMVEVKDAPFRQYQISLPVSGTYPSIRRFVGLALEAVPVAALDQISFSRKRIGDDMVDAEIRLTMYLLDTK